MGKRISRCVELLEQDQAIYYDGPHSGHLLTAAQGRIDAGTWADYMNVGMEHGCFDMTGLADYMRGMADAGPTRSGHRTPTVIVEAPGQWNRRRPCALQRLAVPPDPRPRRAWHPAVPGGNRRRGACLRGILPLSAQYDRRRPCDPLADGADGGRNTGQGRRDRRRRARTVGHRHAGARIGNHGGADLGPVDRRISGALRSLAAQSER